MNEQPDPRTRLLADSLTNDWANGPTSDFARRAAAHARRHRALRRALFTGSVAAAVAVFAFIAMRPPISAPAAQPISHILTASSGASLIARTVSPEVSDSKKSPAFEILSDEEFSRELHDRPVLILPEEREGHRIVLLTP